MIGCESGDRGVYGLPEPREHFRSALPESASDEEKAFAVTRVEQLQFQHHEAMQRLLAIKREETTKLEREM